MFAHATARRRNPRDAERAARRQRARVHCGRRARRWSRSRSRTRSKKASDWCAAPSAPARRMLVGHHRAHSPIVAKARGDRARQARSGDLVGGRRAARCSTSLRHYFDDGPWRRQAGGGPILINMIHEIGILRSLCGEIVAVQAFASNATRGFPVEDTVAINLRFANGALGTFLLSDTAASARSWEQTSQENKAYPTYADEDCYVIVGTGGSLAIPTMRLKLLRPRRGPLVVEAVPHRGRARSTAPIRWNGPARALLRADPRRSETAGQRGATACRTCGSPRRSPRPRAPAASWSTESRRPHERRPGCARR